MKFVQIVQIVSTQEVIYEKHRFHQQCKEGSATGKGRSEVGSS
jgi:hypothetical protein